MIPIQRLISILISCVLRGFLDSWKVEPEMPEVVVLAEDDLAVSPPAGHFE
jgi:hypothetical protein